MGRPITPRATLAPTPKISRARGSGVGLTLAFLAPVVAVLVVAVLLWAGWL